MLRHGSGAWSLLGAACGALVKAARCVGGRKKLSLQGCGGVKGGRGYMYIPLIHGHRIARPDRRPERRVVLRANASRPAGHVLKEGNTLLADEMLVISST